MSYTNSNELELIKENNLYNSPNRFNKTYNTLNTYKLRKSLKTPVIKITKNNKKHFFTNKIILSQNYLKDSYFYNHQKILTFHQNNILQKEKKCKTYDAKNQDIFTNLSSLHKNMLKGKLLKSKLYKSIEKTANEKYIKKKKEREKNMFITMIEEENLDENKSVLNFEKENEENSDDNKENIKSNIINIKPYKILETNKYEENENDDYTSENNINKGNIPKFNSSKNFSNIKNLKYEYNRNNIFSGNINNINNNDLKSKNLLKKKLSFNNMNNKKNKEIDSIKLKPISLPCIKFNNSLNDYFQYILEGNINDKLTLAKTSIAKLKFETTNKALSEQYKTTLEKREFPIDLANIMFYYYLKEQKYFFEFDDLYKKYFQYLYLEIKKNNEELNDLRKIKEKVFKENNLIIKKITDLKEEVKIYEAFKKLCLKIKYKTKNINDIPLEEIKKYGIDLNKYNSNRQIIEIKTKSDKNNNYNNEDEKKIKSPKKIRYSLNKKKPTLRKKISGILIKNYTPKVNEPVFETSDEFFQQFAEVNQNIYKKYQIYNNSFYEKKDLESDVENEKKIEQSPEAKYTKNILKKLSKELYSLKQKNTRLNLYKKQLINKMSIDQNNNSYITLLENNNIIINNEGNSKNKYYLDENENTIALFKIYKKVRKILLNPEIDIEKILKINKLYSLIKEKKTIKDIKFNGNLYSKEVFHIKILELLYLELIQWKKRCLKNKYFRKKFLIIKNEREKALKIYKSHKKLFEDQIHLMKRNEIILDKINKFTILKNKKNDPYYKKYLQDEVIKNEEKLKEEINKTKIETEADKYYNLIQY